MEYRKRESHTRGVYPKQYASNVHRNNKCEARERRRHNNIIRSVGRNLEERNVGTKGKSIKKDLTSADDLTV